MDANSYPIGVDVNGGLIEGNVLFGGEPGAGKLVLLKVATASAALLASGVCDCESYDCRGECCGLGNCSCTAAED
ncbi:hypothetical protein [Actinoplanes awajinensis]|uniref:Uncharacterized protein n=1 Tax=Actinoplanes awajinensis subsp. mycoplanecinus TaxID=135947 RepID=A0A0X3UV79_9ACTN|nr:hypothetical protein [Actinoplanes awajinensis]KUL36453.1 hypothetical protein ADL15_13190 [Actinoplanes awajinensis subsp. mycoplanecinus]